MKFPWITAAIIAAGGWAFSESKPIAPSGTIPPLDELLPLASGRDPALGLLDVRIRLELPWLASLSDEADAAAIRTKMAANAAKISAHLLEHCQGMPTIGNTPAIRVTGTGSTRLITMLWRARFAGAGADGYALGAVRPEVRACLAEAVRKTPMGPYLASLDASRVR